MAEKVTVASLNAQFLAFQVEVRGQIADLESRLTAVANLRGSNPRQNRNIGRPITDNQAEALAKWGDVPRDEDGKPVKGDLQFMWASARLDEYSAMLKAFGIKRYPCNYCDRGMHNDQELARKCAMSGDKRTKSAPAPEASDLELPAYS